MTNFLLLEKLKCVFLVSQDACVSSIGRPANFNFAIASTTVQGFTYGLFQALYVLLSIAEVTGHRITKLSGHDLRFRTRHLEHAVVI